MLLDFLHIVKINNNYLFVQKLWKDTRVFVELSYFSHNYISVFLSVALSTALEPSM